MPADREFVKLLMESMESYKFFGSNVIPIEIKEIYGRLKNKVVKNYLMRLSLRVEENINNIKLLLSCVGNLIEMHSSYPAYAKILKNYSMHIYFNDFLVQAARNTPIISESNPIKLPLKIAFGVIRDLLDVFMNKQPTSQDQVDYEAAKLRCDNLRDQALDQIMSDVDKIDIDEMLNVQKENTTQDVMSTLMNIPEIRNEMARADEDDEKNKTLNESAPIVLDEVPKTESQEPILDLDIKNDDEDEDESLANEKFLKQLNEEVSDVVLPQTNLKKPTSIILPHSNDDERNEKDSGEDPSSPKLIENPADRVENVSMAKTVSESTTSGTSSLPLAQLTADDILFGS